MKPLFLLFLLLSAIASVLYEWAITHVLAQMTAEPFLWETVTIGFYLLGLGAGWKVVSTESKQNPEVFSHTQIFSQIFRIELFLALFGGLSCYFLYFLHACYRIYARDYGMLPELWLGRPLNFFALTQQILIFLIGFWSGKEGNLLFHYAGSVQWLDPIKERIFLGIGYFGALLATFLTVGFQALGWPIAALAFLGGGINLLLGMGVLTQVQASIRKGFALVSVFFLSICAQGLYPTFFQLYLQNYYYNQPSWEYSPTKLELTGPAGVLEFYQHSQALQKIQRSSSWYQNIDLVNDEIHKGHFQVFLNQHFQFNTLNESDYHEHMAFVPIHLQQKVPPNILIIGGGDGLLVKQLLKLPGVESITLVEIDKKILSLAGMEPLVTYNAQAFSNPKVHTIVADGFVWLKLHATHEKFSGIYIDIPSPFSVDEQRLYSREFYRLVADSLDSEGWVVLDVPIDLLHSNAPMNLLLSKTLGAVGMQQILAFGSSYDGFIFAKKTPLSSLPPQGILSLPASGSSEIHSLLKPQKFSLLDASF